MRIFSNECPLEAMDARRQPVYRRTEAEKLKRWMDVSAGVCYGDWEQHESSKMDISSVLTGSRGV